MIKKFSRTEKNLKPIRESKQIATIQEMFEKKSSLYGDKTAYLIRTSDLSTNSFSFKEVFSLSTRLSLRLKRIGLKKGEHVAILGENSPQWAISYFAVIWAGAIAVPLDARATDENVKQVLILSDSRFLIAPAQLTEVFKNTGKVEHIIPMEEIADTGEEVEKGTRREEANCDDIAEIVFTSGTTGNPKGVMLSHENIMSNVETLYSVFDIGTKDTAFSILPIHHVYERICGILLSFYCGQKVFFARSLKPREMLSDLKEARPSVWLNTPLVLEKLFWRMKRSKEESFLTKILPSKLFGKIARKRLGLDRLRLIVSGGAALPNQVSEGLEKYGFPILQGYGMSETSAVVSANPYSKPKNASGGMVLGNTSVEIRDMNSDRIGEICVKGPNVMKGYYKNSQATREIFSDSGWLKTGDLGYFDQDGYLYIAGRKKSVIVTKGGKNISPEEIEEKLISHETIEEAIVFSPDDERIQSVILPNFEEISKRLARFPKDVTNEEIWNIVRDEVTEVNSRLEFHKKIGHFAITEVELPKTTTKKVKRYLFKDMDIPKTTKFIPAVPDK